jgi:hypothetical protein
MLISMDMTSKHDIDVGIVMRKLHLINLHTHGSGHQNFPKISLETEVL